MDHLLRDELTNIIIEELSKVPQVMELTPSGEVLSRESMEAARFHEQATYAQQVAIRALLESWGPTVSVAESGKG